MSSQNSTGSGPHAVVYDLLRSHTKHVHGLSAKRFPWWRPSNRLRCIRSHIEHVHEIKCRDVSAMTVRYEAIEVSFGSPAVVFTTFVNCEVISTLLLADGTPKDV